MGQTNKSTTMKIVKTMKSLVLITLGALLLAIGIEKFLIPNQMIDGGIVGISIMLAQITKLKLAVFLVLLNIPFIILGYKQVGKTFALQSAYGIVVASIFTVFLHHSEGATNDPLLAAVFGGIIVGLGVGVVLRNSGSLDGTEILALLISTKTPFSVGNIVMFFNLFILSSAGFIFGWTAAMYSLITYYIASKTIDVVVQGMSETKSVLIISERYDEIGQAIKERLRRSVTYVDGQGVNPQQKKRLMFSIITRLEEAKLKSIVDDIDKNAFLAIGPVNDVKGSQYRKTSEFH
ncbi:YitT family protein [Sutcliffiella halmapala]|uniref:YitT family protein n=1 Tax=Sutcliffiella halmapala TaxID=79882 RepID=UPI001F1A7504|nr:YitT family protein [Sutcliffiella halmapala]